MTLGSLSPAWPSGDVPLLERFRRGTRPLPPVWRSRLFGLLPAGLQRLLWRDLARRVRRAGR